MRLVKMVCVCGKHGHIQASSTGGPTNLILRVGSYIKGQQPLFNKNKAIFWYMNVAPFRGCLQMYSFRDCLIEKLELCQNFLLSHSIIST